ncbi:potassium channel family protein [Hydrocarboniclastica marina]|uniref:Two pore domain potassium channel family protein n=1 Tax=Hydrocarboniclastica marina TaxID=2259620 RepID=A0A4P7XKG3_9ALTE|nr:potassium channel family protein [Hydrocarboniclastica marina]QCF27621.1 two pore domain potassium channel family protein [Hydrocarboniclastica marina]
MMILQFFRHRQQSCSKITEQLNINMRSRLRRALFWLLGLAALHTIAMMGFEGLGLSDAVWLTLTTLTTVGYGDFSAATPLGRASTIILLYGVGITLLAQLASDYIDYRLKRKEDMVMGRWRWRMKNHVLIINSPNNNPGIYFKRLVTQLRQTSLFADTPVQILTDAFPDGLPENLRRMAVVHHHGESSDPEALKAVTPKDARAIIILARDEYSRVSDSITLDVLLQLKSLCQDRLPYTVAECVEEDSHQRVVQFGANTSLRPIRAYPEMLVRSLVAPGAEKILENLFTHHDDHAMRYPVELTDAVWSETVCQLMAGGMGTLMAYVTADDNVITHPAPDHRFDAKALILMVREEFVPSTQDVEQCLSNRYAGASS